MAASMKITLCVLLASTSLCLAESKKPGSPPTDFFDDVKGNRSTPQNTKPQNALSFDTNPNQNIKDKRNVPIDALNMVPNVNQHLQKRGLPRNIVNFLCVIAGNYHLDSSDPYTPLIIQPMQIKAFYPTPSFYVYTSFKGEAHHVVSKVTQDPKGNVVVQAYKIIAFNIPKFPLAASIVSALTESNLQYSPRCEDTFVPQLGGSFISRKLLCDDIFFDGLSVQLYLTKVSCNGHVILSSMQNNSTHVLLKKSKFKFPSFLNSYGERICDGPCFIHKF